MTRVAEPADLDLDELEGSLRTHFEDLTGQRATLSLDALSDPKVAGELEAVEGRLADCQSELERVQLARAEHGRREVKAAELAERERVAAALAEAERLQGVRETLAQRVDAAASELGEAIAAYLQAAREQQARRRDAGLPAFMAPEPGVEAAVIFALRRAGADRAFGRLAAVRARPLSGEAIQTQSKGSD